MKKRRDTADRRRSPGRARAGLAAVRRRASGALGADTERLEQLERRVGELERELTEARRLNRRLAELTDVVQELLLPAAQRDEERLAERLDGYRAGL